MIGLHAFTTDRYVILDYFCQGINDQINDFSLLYLNGILFIYFEDLYGNLTMYQVIFKQQL